MKLCTECYIQRGGQTLMLHRNKKLDDINQDKWVGLGGKFELGESPEQCLLREVREEAGVVVRNWRLRGIVTFVSEGEPDENLCIFIYTVDAFEGEIDFGACEEGSLQWVDTDKVLDLNLWEGDRLFWGWILEERGLFSARFVYDGETLVKHDVTFY